MPSLITELNEARERYLDLLNKTQNSLKDDSFNNKLTIIKLGDLVYLRKYIGLSKFKNKAFNFSYLPQNNYKNVVSTNDCIISGTLYTDVMHHVQKSATTVTSNAYGSYYATFLPIFSI